MSVLIPPDKLITTLVSRNFISHAFLPWSPQARALSWRGLLVLSGWGNGGRWLGGHIGPFLRKLQAYRNISMKAIIRLHKCVPILWFLCEQMTTLWPMLRLKYFFLKIILCINLFVSIRRKWYSGETVEGNPMTVLSVNTFLDMLLWTAA